MSALLIPAGLYAELQSHLRGRIEQAAFMLADRRSGDGAFQVRELRRVQSEGFDVQTSFHISLRDPTRAELIKWAWDSGACLVEAHSHGDRGLARFSPSDLAGFDEWVPHLWWRLQGRPYAAIVTAGETFDGFAWIEAADRPT